MKNPETGRSRGFGFVSFLDPSRVQVVLSSGPHFLDGRTVSRSMHIPSSPSLTDLLLFWTKIDPKSCNAKGAERVKREAKMMKYPKVFLGGLPSDVNETLLRHFFSKYGKASPPLLPLTPTHRHSPPGPRSPHHVQPGTKVLPW